MMILVFLLPILNAWAETPGTPLQQTQALLTNKAEREKIMAQDPAAKKTNSNVKALGLSEQREEELFQLSADISETLFKGAGEDPQKIAEKLSELQRNPAALEKELTPEQRAKIHDLAKDIEAKQGSAVKTH